jgi:hypothetical protein
VTREARTSNDRPGGTRIFSVYFTAEEEELIRAIASHNATSLSMVVRSSVRRLAGWPAAELQLPPPEKVGPSS